MEKKKENGKKEYFVWGNHTIRISFIFVCSILGR